MKSCTEILWLYRRKIHELVILPIKGGSHALPVLGWPKAFSGQSKTLLARWKRRGKYLVWCPEKKETLDQRHFSDRQSSVSSWHKETSPPYPKDWKLRNSLLRCQNVAAMRSDVLSMAPLALSGCSDHSRRALSPMVTAEYVLHKENTPLLCAPRLRTVPKRTVVRRFQESPSLFYIIKSGYCASQEPMV